MKQILTLLLVFLVSCSNNEVTEIPTVTATKAIPTAIPTNPSLPPTSLLSITPTITLATDISCDPFSVDFCITDGHFILQRPIHPPANDLIDPTYAYASTANGTREPHHGVEFPNKSGTLVYAAAAGTVIFAGPDQIAAYSPWVNFYGNLVVIKNNDDLFTLYAHLSKIDVEEGQAVSAGDKIGEVGRTGVAIGSHLHFEVRYGTAEDYFATQNPELWLIPAKDANGDPFGTLVMSIVDQDHHLVERAKFTIGDYSDRSQPPIKTYYGMTYSGDMLNGDENAALGELPAGNYRIVLERNGQIYERWVEVESGKLTKVAFVVK